MSGQAGGRAARRRFLGTAGGSLGLSSMGSLAGGARWLGAAPWLSLAGCAGPGGSGDAASSSGMSAANPLGTIPSGGHRHPELGEPGVGNAAVGNPTAGNSAVGNPFALGVASGDPTPTSVVLWTRLIGPDVDEDVADAGDPRPSEGPGAKADHGRVGPASREARLVHWEVADDAAFSSIVSRGVAEAVPALGCSVHVDVQGLSPGRWYFYRFHGGRNTRGGTSTVGRTRTADAADADPRQVRFAFASCQQYEQGWYGAYQAMLHDDVDLVVFLGDYIYESSWGRAHVRTHGTPAPRTLTEYRQRYALYKTDPDLQRMHAAAPWVVTWDDHEVENDYAADQGEILAQDFLSRRAAAYQAWAEHQPVRAMIGAAQRVAAGQPVAWQDLRIYRRIDFSPLVSFFVLDDRQYRDHQACPRPGRGGSHVVEFARCAELADPRRTLLGRAQEAWLAQQMRQAPARWNVFAQQTLFSRVDRDPGPGEAYWTDGWDGYPAARQRLIDAMIASRLSNPLMIGGDVHAHWVCDVKADFARASSATVATEFCGTSITSQGGPQSRHDEARALNPWVRLADATHRGYGLLTVERGRATCALRVIDDEKVMRPTAGTLATFSVDSGRPGARRA